MAGAPGIEPGITGSKPVALPLGYAPPRGGPNIVRSHAPFNGLFVHKADNSARQWQIGLAQRSARINHDLVLEGSPVDFLELVMIHQQKNDVSLGKSLIKAHEANIAALGQ